MQMTLMSDDASSYWYHFFHLIAEGIERGMFPQQHDPLGHLSIRWPILMLT